MLSLGNKIKMQSNVRELITTRFNEQSKKDTREEIQAKVTTTRRFAQAHNSTSFHLFQNFKN